MYADQLSQGLRPQAAQLTFYVRQGGDDDGLGEVAAELPSYGSLGPLFYAFGLISEEELRQGAGSVSGRSERRPRVCLRPTRLPSCLLACSPSA